MTWGRKDESNIFCGQIKLGFQNVIGNLFAIIISTNLWVYDKI